MKNQESIQLFKKKLLSSLIESEENKQYTHKQLDEFCKNESITKFYSCALELFVHLTFSEEEARLHWENIFKNLEFLEKSINRKVGLQVAICDYFLNINQMLKNPILVEIHLFKRNEKLALIDSLTGLFNRRYFDLAIKSEIKRAQRFDKIFSILLLDIDNFKKVNDTKGHLFGDKVLKSLATVVKDISRELDIICRYGGEEFIIILPETTGNGALKFSERLREIFKTTPLYKTHKITFSAGIATFPYDGKTVSQLVNNADKALYAAKYSGKDCIVKCKNENRRYFRFNSSWKIEFKSLDTSLDNLKGSEIYTQDISMGGIRFETSEKLELEAKLLLNIFMPDGVKLIIIGKIMWMKKEDNNLFTYGLQFYDMNSEQLSILKMHLNVKN